MTLWQKYTNCEMRLKVYWYCL